MLQTLRLRTFVVNAVNAFVVLLVLSAATTSPWPPSLSSFSVPSSSSFIIVAQAEQVLRVGLIASSIGPMSIYGAGRDAVARWFIEQENNRVDGCLANNNMRVELHVRDIKSNMTIVEAVTRELVHDVGVSFLVGAESILGVVSAPIAAERGVPTCVPMDGNDGSFITPNGKRRHQHVFGTMTPASVYFAGFYEMAANNGARRLAIIDGSGPGFDTLLWMGSRSKAYAEDAGLEVVFSRTFAYDSLAMARDDEETKIGAFFDELVASKPDVVAFATIHGCHTFLVMTRRFQWRPKGAIVFECLNKLGSFEDMDSAMIDELRGVFVPVQWHHALKGRAFSDEPNRDFASAFPFTPGTGDTPSAQQMHTVLTDVLARVGAKFHSLVPADAACYYALFSGACATNSTDPEQLRLGVQATFMPTFAGSQAFSWLGQPAVKEMVLMQLPQDPRSPMTQVEADALGGSKPHASQVALSPATNSDYEPFWGLPSFAQLRVNIDAWSFTHAADKLLLAFMVVVAAVVVTVMYLIGHVYRGQPAVKAISVSYAMLNLFGLLVILTAAATFGVNVNEHMCRARWILAVLGMTLATTPLCAKLYRVIVIYHSDTLFVDKRKVTQPIQTWGCSPSRALRQLSRWCRGHASHGADHVSSEYTFHVYIIDLYIAAACLSATVIMMLLVVLPGQTTTVLRTPAGMDRSSWYTECHYKLDYVEVAACLLCFVEMGVALAFAIMARNVPNKYAASVMTALAVYTDIFLTVIFVLAWTQFDDHAVSVALVHAVLVAFPLVNIVPLYLRPIYLASKGIDPKMLGIDYKTDNHTVLENSATLGGPAAAGVEFGGRSSMNGPAQRVSSPAQRVSSPVAPSQSQPQSQAPAQAQVQAQTQAQVQAQAQAQAQTQPSSTGDASQQQQWARVRGQSNSKYRPADEPKETVHLPGSYVDSVGVGSAEV